MVRQKVMNFRALPVYVGDAFLLHSPFGTTLVDAGQNKKHILKLLKQERITKNHFNLLVCTHYDADHIKGIIGILESQSYTFDEIWLPEILGSLAYTVSETLMDILKRLRNLNPEDVENLIQKAKDISRNETPPKIPEDSPIKTANLDTLKDYLQFYRYHEHLFLIHHVLDWPSPSDLPIQAMLTNLNAAMTAVSSSLSSGAHVRWFHYSKDMTNKHYDDFGMSTLNSIETAVTLYKPDVFLQQLYLTTINVESLVFKFSCENYPEVLFCADSDLSFTNNHIKLKDESVVTAPHHGSDSCNNAYGRIDGSDLIYVRSDRSQTQRPGKGFLGQSNRYCTICRNKGPKQKVEVSYKGGTPKVRGKKCKCK
ncbi:MAG: hypothetical protein AB1641_05065 [Thermodesulfobacteriota bacterium]